MGKASNELPSSVSHERSVKRYGGLILVLGHLASDQLLENQGQSLVFSKDVFKTYVPDEFEDSLSVSLVLGILTKTETLTRGIKKMESFAFCHKTFQEFFAAVWIAIKYKEEKQKLSDRIKTVNDVFEYGAKKKSKNYLTVLKQSLMCSNTVQGRKTKTI